MTNSFCFVILAAICFAQVCWTAPAGDASSKSEEHFTDAQIDKIRSQLKGKPGLSSNAVDNFIEILRKFREETPEREKVVGVIDLLALALQKCDKKKVDLSKLLDTSIGKLGENDDLTDAHLREAQEELAKLVSAEQVQHAMKILNGFRAGATKEQNHAAMIDLMSSAEEALKAECVAN